MNPYVAAIEAVTQHAKHVTLHADRLKEIAVLWRNDAFPIPNWHMPVFPATDDETFINFLGVGNAVNFCFTDPITLRKYAITYQGTEWRGALGMWAAFTRALDEGGPLLDPRYLINMTENECAHIFRSKNPIPMFEERLTQLRLAGIAQRYWLGGSFASLFKRCGYRAFNGGEGIVEQLAAYDVEYMDATFHKPTRTTLNFHKRANLFVMMYHGRALASEGALEPITDAALLTPPADYEIPRALRHLGILSYDEKLERRIAVRKVIAHGSREEQEIRAMTVYAMNLLTEELSRARGEPVSIAALDFKVWSAGRESPKPHHLTLTTAY